MVGDLNGTQTTRIKGNRMRIDMTQGDKATALILDIDGQRMIAIDAKKREATITPQAKLRRSWARPRPARSRRRSRRPPRPRPSPA